MTRLRPIKRTLVAILAIFALLPVLQAQAGPITGIADENLEDWSPGIWSSFNATGVNQVRHIVPWNVAMGGPVHAADLAETENWINAAQAKGLQILISFRYEYCTDQTKAELESEGRTCPGALPPSAAEYLTAVGKFRGKFPQITTYTAWNEPNHTHASKYAPGQDANPAKFPWLAAAYWINLNFVCNLPKYGPSCTVIGGDFLDPNGNGEAFKNYLNSYKATLAESKVSPSTWAIHPYTAAETGSWSLVDSKFMNLTENKPVWFTEVGGMVCRPGQVGQSGGLTAATLQASEEFQNNSTKNLINGINARPRVQRAYYYSLSGGDSAWACPLPNGKYIWDSALLSMEIPRQAYYTAFPHITPPKNYKPDFSGDGRADIIAREPDGTLWEYRGSGLGGWFPGNRIWLGGGWNMFNTIVSMGDFNGDGKADVIGRKPNGDLCLYKGNGASWWLNVDCPTPMGGGTQIYDALIGPGDFSGDGKADLIAREPNGSLWVYEGNGAGGWVTGNRVALGGGWQMFDTIIAPGDFSGDGKADVIGRKPNGDLCLYKGNGANWWINTSCYSLGGGWQMFDKLIAPGDFSGDGKSDVIGRKPNGDLCLYRGNGASWWIDTECKAPIGTGWNIFDALIGA